MFSPTAIVAGTATPLMLKPAPDALAAETVTFAVPEFVNVKGTDALLPTSRLPKLILEGLAERATCVPAPLRAMVGSDVPALIEMLPDAFPAVVGTNATVNFVLSPAVRVNGVAIPVTLKPVPLALTCVTVTLPFPVLVKVVD